MNINEKYPIMYAQRFNVIDARLDQLQHEIDINVEAARYIEIKENIQGYITITLLNPEDKVLSTGQITLTSKLICSSELDLENKQIVFTCLNGSKLYCDISELLNGVNSLELRVSAIENTLSSGLTYEETLAILEGIE